MLWQERVAKSIGSICTSGNVSLSHNLSALISHVTRYLFHIDHKKNSPWKIAPFKFFRSYICRIILRTLGFRTWICSFLNYSVCLLSVYYFFTFNTVKIWLVSYRDGLSETHWQAQTCLVRHISYHIQLRLPLCFESLYSLQCISEGTVVPPPVYVTDSLEHLYGMALFQQSSLKYTRNSY